MNVEQIESTPKLVNFNALKDGQLFLGSSSKNLCIKGKDYDSNKRGYTVLSGNNSGQFFICSMAHNWMVTPVYQTEPLKYKLTE